VGRPRRRERHRRASRHAAKPALLSQPSALDAAPAQPLLHAHGAARARSRSPNTQAAQASRGSTGCLALPCAALCSVCYGVAPKPPRSLLTRQNTKCVAMEIGGQGQGGGGQGRRARHPRHWQRRLTTSRVSSPLCLAQYKGLRCSRPKVARTGAACRLSLPRLVPPSTLSLLYSKPARAACHPGAFRAQGAASTAHDQAQARPGLARGKHVQAGVAAAEQAPRQPSTWQRARLVCW